MTDKLQSYPVAQRELMLDVIHITKRHANSRVEQSHDSTRLRERLVRRFKSSIQAQRFVTAHAGDHNPFNLGRQLVRAGHYPDLRAGAFRKWSTMVA